MTIQLGGQAVPISANIDIVLLCAGLLLGYAALVRRYGAVLAPGPDQRPVTRRQVTAFVAGVLTLWLASGSPLHQLADGYLFSAHMVQHLLQAFVMAPLLLLGLPGWMLELITRRPLVRGFVRTFGQPLVAGLVFNVVFLAIHWPNVVTGMVQSTVFHEAAHILIVLSSLLMWLPVLSDSPAVQRRLTPLPRMGYLFAMTILPTVPASFLTFGDPRAPIYPVYAQFPRLWDIGVGQDMLIAGLLMKIGGGFLLWGIIATMFFRWAADEERRDGGAPGPGRPTRDPRSTSSR